MSQNMVATRGHADLVKEFTFPYPLLTITRVATRDTELAGVPIPAGSSVMPMLGAANRQDD